MNRPAPAAEALNALSTDYAPLPGIPDEFVGRDGAPRACWQQFLGLLGGSDIERAIAAANRHIRAMGISYRVLGETSERTWPMSHLPLLIDEGEWTVIAAGVSQRARLIEAVLADVYGPNRLVAEGVVPAAVVAGSRDYLRPMVGVTPPGGHWMHLYAVDLGRGPDGRWWVLSDRAQAPSGAGYLLENRLVMSRAFPAIYRNMNVERLAPFFRAFRMALTAAAERSQPRICLLTPGPYSATYFEQAYLARYLGFTLVEGNDIVVHEGRAHIRTVAGLKRADVLWRRVDGDYIDPLELNGQSRLGVPGLVSAIRNGHTVVSNMPGAGFAESRALMAFMPAIARHLLGEDLSMPNIATWWCGQPDAQARVLANLDSMAIAGAFDDALPDFGARQQLLPADLGPSDRERLRRDIEARGLDFVGQEVVQLSTTPVWRDGRPVPRPFVLRVFAAVTPDGWHVMPGGFCRIADRTDARAVTMGDGVQSADVWVLSSRPVAMETLLPASEEVKIRRVLGNLPSRAADNLFWYGRYLERAEATLRVVRCLCARSTEMDLSLGDVSDSLRRLGRQLRAWGAVPAKDFEGSTLDIARYALSSPDQYGSVLSVVRMARGAAAVIRERLSVDVWQLLATLEERATLRPGDLENEAEAHERADLLLRTLAALAGLGQENTNRVAGWRFLDMGRRIERAISTCRFARVFAGEDATADDLDILLDLIDSQITYRSRYLVGVALAPVRDMVLLDPFNPRSVCFQINQLDRHLGMLPVLNNDGMPEQPKRLIARLATRVSTGVAEELDTASIFALEQKVMALAEAIAARYFLQRPEATTSTFVSTLA